MEGLSAILRTRPWPSAGLCVSCPATSGTTLFTPSASSVGLFSLCFLYLSLGLSLGGRIHRPPPGCPCGQSPTPSSAVGAAGVSHSPESLERWVYPPVTRAWHRTVLGSVYSINWEEGLAGPTLTAGSSAPSRSQSASGGGGGGSGHDRSSLHLGTYDRAEGENRREELCWREGGSCVLSGRPRRKGKSVHAGRKSSPRCGAPGRRPRRQGPPRRAACASDPSLAVCSCGHAAVPVVRRIPVPSERTPLLTQQTLGPRVTRKTVFTAD